jgi:hypothetical protein
MMRTRVDAHFVSKYEALCHHLVAVDLPVVTLPFAEVSEIVGGLPPSAYDHPAWWSNEAGGSRHVQCESGWLAAGYRVEHVDLLGGRVTFRRED